MEGGEHQVEKPTWMSRIRFLSPTAVTCRTLRVKRKILSLYVECRYSSFFFFFPFNLRLLVFFFPLCSSDIDYFSFELKLTLN